MKDEKELPKLPDLDKDLVEAIENPDAKPEKNGNGKGKK